jgi:hypothetical protein
VRISNVGVLISIFVLINVSLWAQQPVVSAIQSDPQALHLLTKAFSLMGGAQKSMLADVRVEGSLSSPMTPSEISGNFIGKIRGSDWSLETTHDTDVISYRVLNGRGSIRQKATTKPLTPAVTLGLTLDILPIFGRWTEFTEPGSVATLTGSLIIDGVNCQQIHVHSGRVAPDGRFANHHGDLDVFIDSTSGLIAAIRYKANMNDNGKTVQIENRFGNYREIGGMFVPTQVTRYLADHPIIIFTIRTVLTNTGSKDVDFQN